jgi:hypothetical protein
LTKHPFEYQKPTDAQAVTMIEINAQFKLVYDDIILFVPDGRERALAITNLQQARMWVNAAIVLHT